MSLGMSSFRASLALLLVSLAPSLADADTSLVATGAVDTGYNTNIQGTPETDDPMAPQVISDGFMTLRPGLSAAYERPRSTHNLNYIFGAQLFLESSEANSYSNTLAYQGIVTVSPRGSLRLGSSFNAGRVNNFNQPGQQVAQPGDVQPNGNTEFVAYNANIGYRHQLSQRMTGAATLNGARLVPSNQDQVGPTTTGDLRFRVDRTFRYHLLGVETRLTYTKQETPEPQRTLIAGPGVFWTWNISETISTNVTAGIDAVGEYPAFSRGLTVPRGSAALTYSTERGRATAGYSRGATVNIFGGNTTIDSSYFLNAGLPVPLPIRRPVILTAGVIYSKGRVIDLDIGETRGRNTRKSADVGLITQINPAWNAGLRFSTSKQDRNDVNEMGIMLDTTNRQSVVSLTISGRFPETMAGQVTRESSDRVESGNLDFEPDAPPAQAP